MTDATSAAQTDVSNAGAAGSASTISRDDIQNIFESMKNSLDTRFANLESQMSTLKQATTDTQTQTEHVIDVGADEAQMRGIVNDSHKWSSNDKRTYDEYQSLSLTDARQKQEYASRSRDHYDMLQGDNRAHIANLRKIELELLQNGNTAAKIGDNRMWTTDTEALEATVAAVIAKILDTKDQTSSS
jgi:hypothetical protein